MLSDAKSRVAARDPHKSALVFAGAGAGKTTELILSLFASLKLAEYPEQVLAITFTNKASSEMRTRAVQLLKASQLNKPINSEHERLSRELANDVLKRDEEKGWGLIKNPARLQIKTIDALCAYIAKRFPLSSGLGSQVGICQNPHTLYEAAASAFLQDYNKDVEHAVAIQKLISHTNNRFDKASELLVSMLAKRDQWLPLVFEAKSLENIRGTLNKGNMLLINALVSPFLNVLHQHEQKVLELVRYSLNGAELENAEILQSIIDAGSLPVQITCTESMRQCGALAAWLITQTGKAQCYKTATAKRGFAPATAFEDKVQKQMAKQMKGEYAALTACLNETLEAEQLEALRHVDTFEYSKAEWALLESLFECLPVLASKLKLEFTRADEVDFIEMSACALQALGPEDEPSDAALTLDRQIKSIMVDEFQDTNLFQIQLLRRLMAGWEVDDGRRFYGVGDPMQSIYAFRAAVVSLFLDVAKNGINDIKPEVYHYDANFRAQAGLVDFVNAVFSTEDNAIDLNTGKTPYHIAYAQKPALNCDAVVSRVFTGTGAKAAESQWVCQQISHIHEKDPQASVAVLGRTRADLSEILEQLNKAKKGHRAVKLFKLSMEPVILDLTALARALAHLGDKQAWVALCRSGLVGLSLDEIHTLSGAKQGKYLTKILSSNFNDKQLLSLLETSSQERVKKLKSVVEHSLEQLHRKSFATIVRGAFYALGGMSLLASERDQKNIESFFTLLSRFDVNRFDLHEFTGELDKLYAEDLHASTNVQLMTIHQAKGLEFDYVIVPACEKTSRSDDVQLLLTDLVYEESAGIPRSVLAPAPQSGYKGKSIYNTIRYLQKIKRKEESKRLALVALTRAKKQMFLSAKGKAERDFSQFGPGSIFSVVRHVIDNEVGYSHLDAEEQHTDTIPLRRMLEHPVTTVLPEGKLLARYRGKMQVDNTVLPKIEWARTMKRIVGTVLHIELRKIATHGLTRYFEQPLETKHDGWRVLLRQYGLEPRMMFSALQRLQRQLTTLRADNNVNWLFKTRQTTECEKSMCLILSGKLEQRIIDLTFVESGWRYIIDYKSDEPSPDESRPNFEQRMLDTYRHKMLEYDKCFEQEGNNIRKLLYLTSIGTVVFYDAHANAIGY